MSRCHALVVDSNANASHVYRLVKLLTDQDLITTAITNPRLLDGVLIGLDSLDVVFVDPEAAAAAGVDVVSTLRSDMRYATVPVVAYTARPEAIVATRYTWVMPKHFDQRCFPLLLRRILHSDCIPGYVQSFAVAQ
jgi:hypothetical protein